MKRGTIAVTAGLCIALAAGAAGACTGCSSDSFYNPAESTAFASTVTTSSCSNATEQKCINAAKAVVKKICKSSMSKSEKLKVCFNWVMKKNYAIHRTFVYKTSWPAKYAMDHFNNKNGDCHSDAAALCYLASAIGYTKVYACTDTKQSSWEDCHAWAEINGKVYDPLFAQAKSYKKYYGCKKSSYELQAVGKIKIPFSS